MTKKTSKKNFNFKNIKEFLSYIIVGAIAIIVVFVGSLDKRNSTKSTIDLSAFATEEYEISTDQLSELYIVANLSDSFSLASANDTASNYVMTSSMHDMGRTTASKISKGSIIDTSNLNRGIIVYTVQNGESMEDIAKRYGLTTDQIRWSNDLKDTSISDGDTLYLPTTPGIIYVVKEDDTLESIASTYGSSVEEITILNDLETSDISEGMSIIIANGELPEEERPEYVAPVVYSTYTTSGSGGSRSNMEVIQYNFGSYGGYGWGQCTSWAWYNRQDLPTNLGNANTWAVNAAAQGFPVDNTPQAGDVFQSGGGWYGHVGYVESVNADGSIVITEANFGYYVGRITRSTMSASAARELNFIHRK